MGPSLMLFVYEQACIIRGVSCCVFGEMNHSALEN